MTSQQTIADRAIEYLEGLEQKRQKLNMEHYIASNILESHNEPAHDRLENANLELGSIVENDPVFLKLLKYVPTDRYDPKVIGLNPGSIKDEEARKLRSRTMDEKTYTAYLNASKSELDKLLFRWC